MTTLRLFHRNDPFREVGARQLDCGELSIGRDPGAGWAINDPAMTLSRSHCVVSLDQGRLTLRDTSSNGVFLGREKLRAPRDAAVPVVADTIHLGEFLIVVEPGDPPPAASAGADGAALEAPFDRPILASANPDASAMAVPSRWASEDDDSAQTPDRAAATPDSTPPGEGALLESFCAGAHLEVSAFSGEDPAEVMRRLGAVYQQMVLGLVELMDERTSVRGEFRMDQTTVKADGNNPFRWASAERVAVDLLRVSGSGFLIGPSAVKASFVDVKKHLACILAGMRGALETVIEGLNPKAVERELGAPSFLGRRAASYWSAYLERHEQLRRLSHEDREGPISQGFRGAYERQLNQLDAAGAAS
ncbi:MAG TPA: type VI secretion system-associated FHA domain protein TagH [Caulobacteraceae bacterium]